MSQRHRQRPRSKLFLLHSHCPVLPCQGKHGELRPQSALESLSGLLAQTRHCQSLVELATTWLLFKDAKHKYLGYCGGITNHQLLPSALSFVLARLNIGLGVEHDSVTDFESRNALT
jgi:hypothetical protein